MRPFIFLSSLLLVSLIVITSITIYTSPVNEKGYLVWQTYLPFLTSLFLAITSLTSMVFMLIQRLYERVIKKKRYEEQKIHRRRYWKAAMRRGLLTGLFITAVAAFRLFQIDNELNFALLTSIVALTEVLLWRYYTR